MKIYSGIRDADGNVPWIDDETGEEGADKDGSLTLNLKYKRVKAQFGGDVNPAMDDEELAILMKGLT